MSHPFTRLVARYGPDHGLYLYGEWCLLQTLGPEAFRARHTPDQLARLAAQLGPLELWPDGLTAGHEGDGGAHPDAGPPPDPLAAVAASLAGEPIALWCGADLFYAIGDWAAAGGVAPGAWFEASRSALTATLGFIPPTLAVGLAPDLPGTAYRLTIWREAVLEGEVHPGLDLVIGPEDAAPPPLPYPWTPDPTGTGWVAWMPVGPASEPPPDLARVHWMVAIDRHLAASLPPLADRLITPAVVQALLTEAERAGYDHELERYVSIPELRLVFRALLRQGLPLRPIAPMLEAMLRAILAELATRPLTPPDIEKLQRQLPVFPTGKLVGVIRVAQGLAPEPPGGDAARLNRLARAGAPGPVPRPAPTDPAEQAAWRDLAARVAATRPAAERLSAHLRAADMKLRRHPWGGLDALAPPSGGAAADPAAVEAFATDVHSYARGREAWREWGRVADLVRRAGLALAGQGPWPPNAEDPARPDWRWALDRPGRLLEGVPVGT